MPNNKKPDYVFITLLFIITFFGLVMLSSASTVIAFQKFQDSYHYLKHQIIYGLIPGLALFFLFSKINYKFWKKFAFIILIFGIALLILVFVPKISATYSPAKSWIHIGDFSLQPSEIVKLAFLIYLSAWFAEKGKDLTSWQFGLFPFLLALGIVAGLVILQPDIGTVFIIVIMSLVVFYVAGGRLLHLFFLTGVGAGALALLIKIAPYRAQRLTIFLHPEFDPQNIGYHINQALLAIGSGGIFGLGLGQSRQKFQYLPQVIADSIFAIIAEELGFILTAGFIILFLALFFRGLKIAKSAPDAFSRYLICGIISWWSFQAMINIGGMFNLLPMTGLPLPFVSYGGSALVVSLAAAGIVVNVSKDGGY